MQPKLRLSTVVVIGFFAVLVLFLVGGFAALSLAGRVVFVLFLPGFAILQAVASREFDGLEKMVLSPIIGIAFTSLIALYLTFAKVPINGYTIVLSALLASVPLLAYSWKKGKLKTSLKPATMPTAYLILILLIVVSVLLISLPWSKNGVLIPLGDDPATSTLAAAMIAEQGKIPASWAPYFAEQTQFTFPPGYPSVIAFLYLLDPSMSMPVLVSCFSVFFAVIHGEIFVLTRRVLHDDRIALCATALSALVSVGFYQMVDFGRFPALVGVALTLSLLLFSFIYSGGGNRKLLLLSGIVLSSLFLTYTVSFLSAALFVVLFFLSGLLFFKNRKQNLLGAATVIALGIALAFPWILNILSRLTIQIPLREYQALLLWFDFSSLKAEFGPANLTIYYGYWLLLIGLMGTLIVFVHKRSGSFLLAWFLSLFLLMLNEIFKIPFPSWYYLQTGAFLNPALSFPLSVLAAVGVVKFYDILKCKLQIRFPSRKLMKTYLPLLLIVVLLFSVFYLQAKPTIDKAVNQTNRISNADYNAIMWISNNTAQDAVIFNDHWIGSPSTWIPIISHRRIVMPCLSISEVGWTNTMFTRQDESRTIAASPDSAEALGILQKYDVSFIYLSNNVSRQVQSWRDNYNATLFLQSLHYQAAFNEDNAWVLKVIY